MNNLFFCNNRRNIEHISLKDSKPILQRGFEYFLGKGYQWLPEYDLVADWLSDNNNKGLMLFGANGRGKTVICEKIFPIIFRYYLNMDFYMIDAINLSEYYTIQTDYFYLTSSIPLIIDDIGAESFASEYGEKRDLVSEIIDLSEKRSRLVILTTNLTPQEIEERYGLRTLDRLKSIVRAIKFHGESLRG